MAWHRYRTPKLSRPHYSALAERLAKKIERDTGLVCDPSTFTRSYAGYWQKSSGAWLWSMQVKDIPHEIGSCDPASECVKSKYHLELLNSGDEIVAELTEGKTANT